MTSTPEVPLPELPEAFAYRWWSEIMDCGGFSFERSTHPDYTDTRLYTADQLRAYALAALAARPGRVSVAERLPPAIAREVDEYFFRKAWEDWFSPDVQVALSAEARAAAALAALHTQEGEGK